MILCENCRGQLSIREEINVKDMLEIGKLKISCLDFFLGAGNQSSLCRLNRISGWGGKWPLIHRGRSPIECS